MFCGWCDRYTRMLTRVIVNSTQEESYACDDCLEHYGDDATGELNSVRYPEDAIVRRVGGQITQPSKEET